MTFAEIKLIHETAAAISIIGFIARGAGMLGGARWLARRSVKTLPHVVDTVLLASAITLAWELRLSPLATPWLAAKIVGLVVYIVVGMFALRLGRTRAVRATAFVAAVVVFAWIVSVAFTKDPRGFLLLLSP
ncbi:MAG TPA: SirB2 family protein [Casimicrobiaceae bacterium]|nr:SirB2 family protein [Candidatus Binatia bacterium]